MPKKPTLKFRDNVDNAFILNAIRKNATSDYQRRVPEATKANIQDNMSNIMNHMATRNEFLNALVNQIGLVKVRNLNWNNPLGVFKIGELEFGESIEEVQVGLVGSYVYDADRDHLEKALFGQHRPNVQAAIHKINRQEYYPVTVNNTMLKRAFAPGNAHGLDALLNEIMASPTTSDNYDEFMAMCSLFPEYENAGGFFNVNVQDMSDLDVSNETSAKALLKKIRAYTGKLQYLSPHYNASGMHSAAKVDDMVLLTTPEAQASIDVDALAATFNTSLAEVQSRVITIPQENFGMPGTQAILTTSDFFVVADTHYGMTSQPNAVGLTENFFLHHHQIISASPFVPAIRFSLDAGDTITLTDTPVTEIASTGLEDRDGNAVTSAERGDYVQVLAAAGTTPEGGVNDSVRLELAGAESPRTYLTNTGALYPALDESSEKLTVTVMAVDDNTVQATVEVPLTGDIAVLWPNPEVVEDVPDPEPGE